MSDRMLFLLARLIVWLTVAVVISLLILAGGWRTIIVFGLMAWGIAFFFSAIILTLGEAGEVGQPPPPPSDE